MTRDEAIMRVANEEAVIGPFTPDNLVSALARLGLLSFDEPKDAWDKFREAVIGYDSQSSDLTLADADSLAARIDRAGLKIVEK